jgi:polyisoprenoid-binding protein YceI
MRPAFVVIAAGLTLAGTTALWSAPKELPGQADKSRIAAGTYLTDPSHTLVGWRVGHMGFNDYLGLFGEIKGTLVLDPARPEAARVSARIPVGKVLTASAGLTGALLRPGGVGGKPAYFGPKPADALFTSTAVKPGADGTSALIEGNLTLNGKTRPVTIAAQFSGAGKNPYTGKQTVGFHGTARIMRSEFGLESDLGLVADRVDLEISAAFELQKP